MQYFKKLINKLKDISKIEVNIQNQDKTMSEDLS